MEPYHRLQQPRMLKEASPPIWIDKIGIADIKTVLLYGELCKDEVFIVVRLKERARMVRNQKESSLVRH